MNKFKDFSSFFFPSKGTFGGVQRRSANGYPQVFSNKSQTEVRTEDELRKAVKDYVDGTIIKISGDITVNSTVTIRKDRVRIDGGGGRIICGTDGMTCFAFAQPSGSTSSYVDGVNISNVFFTGTNNEKRFGTVFDPRHGLSNSVFSGLVFVCSQNIFATSTSDEMESCVIQSCLWSSTGSGAGTYRFFNGLASNCVISGNKVGNNGIVITGGGSGNNAISGNAMAGGEVDTSGSGGNNLISANSNIGTISPAPGDIYRATASYPFNS